MKNGKSGKSGVQSVSGKGDADGGGGTAPPVGSPQLYYTIRSPWSWVMERIANDPAPARSLGCSSILAVPSSKELPSSRGDPQGNGSSRTPPRNRRSSSMSKKAPQPCTLRVEVAISSNNGAAPQLAEAVHGTSNAFDGLEDKDELVRTVQRCRCEELNITPPSILIKWDVTKSECANVVGARLPALHDREEREGGGKYVDEEDGGTVAVLKAPLGSRGDGIYFVQSVDEIHEIIEDSRKRTLEAGPDFLDGIIEQKGRIPSWVLQAEIYPSLLINNGRKFHIRTYVAAVEKLEHEDVLDVFIYNRHEVRIAAHPVSMNAADDGVEVTNGRSRPSLAKFTKFGSSRRNRLAHITNGAGSVETERVLMQNVEELVDMNMQAKVEMFVAQAFGIHFVTDMVRRAVFSARQEVNSNVGRKFAIAGLDIMVTTDGRLYLLEANVNPAAPPEDMVEGDFEDHLVGFMTDLLGLAFGRKVQPPENNRFKTGDNWISAKDVLRRTGAGGQDTGGRI